MNSKELEYALALKSLKNIGTKTQAQICKFYPSFEAIFEDSAIARKKIPVWGSKLDAAIKSVNNKIQFKRELGFIEKYNINVISIYDSSYPELLKDINDPPILLFVKGSMPDKWSNSISVVGMRNASLKAPIHINTIIRDLKAFKPLIVSGLAYGIDAIAHRAAISNQLKTVAVLAHGLSLIYPASHRGLAAQIIDSGGALITEYLFEQKPNRVHFPIRNRIVAGLTQGLLLAESKLKGGAMISANLAHAYDRIVFALPGGLNEVHSEGCLSLIKSQKALLCTHANDIVEALNWQQILELDFKRDDKLKKDFTNNSHRNLYHYLLEHGGADFNTLLSKWSLGHIELSTALLEMEMEGLLKLNLKQEYHLV